MTTSALISFARPPRPVPRIMPTDGVAEVFVRRKFIVSLICCRKGDMFYLRLTICDFRMPLHLCLLLAVYCSQFLDDLINLDRLFSRSPGQISRQLVVINFKGFYEFDFRIEQQFQPAHDRFFLRSQIANLVLRA
jgi:hypothetical protein